MKRLSWMCVILLVGAQWIASAQLVEFAAASIKENKADLGDGGSARMMPDGGFSARHMTAYSLITIGYQLRSYQVVDVPAWTRVTYYDVTAKPAAPATQEQTYAMLRKLLADRFNFAAHRENREVEGFALMRSGSLGPNLHPSDLDCVKLLSTVPRCREGGLTFEKTRAMKAIGVPVSRIVDVIVSQVGAPVSDDTNLSGTFDVELRWSNDLAPSDDVVPLVTALPEQLGLKLERRRVTTEILVIDRMERATAD
jgi:uncharacterized protein (TIGR03435 family)